MTIRWPGAAFLAVGILLTGISTLHAAPTGETADRDIVILQEGDDAPAAATLIRHLRLTATSYADSCAWFELLLKGTRIAAASGGNIVKIVERSPRRLESCDVLELAVYHADSPRDADRSFAWAADRTLRWADFQGMPRTDASARIAAETACGISVETSLAPESARARIYVFNTFDKRQSWVRIRSESVLRHEQGHWDLCELYTRKMQARFDAQCIRGARLNEFVSRIYDQVEADYLRRQQAYELETRHGLDPAAQLRWEQQIAQELAVDSGK